MALSPKEVEQLDALIFREHAIVSQYLHDPLKVFAQPWTHVDEFLIGQEISNVFHF